MSFWITMSICNFIIPAIMLVISFLSKKKIPKKINGLCGYRTENSMKSQDTWDFAQKYCGKLWLKIAIVLIIISIIITILTFNKSETFIAISTVIYEMFQCAAVICSIIPIERALKENFKE